MNLLFAGLPIVVGAGLVAAGIALVLHRSIPDATRSEFREHSTQITGVVGTLFAITAGFLVVTTWNALGHASNNVTTEASALVDSYWYARTLPEPQKAELTTLLRNYTTVAVDEEWPLMSRDKTLSPAAWAKVDQIRLFLESMPPGEADDSHANARYSQALSRVREVSDARRTRIGDAKTGVPPILWAALGLAGLLVVSVPVAIGAPKRWVHALLAFFAAAVVSFMLFLIWEFNNPFGGEVSVSSSPMDEALVAYDLIDESTLPPEMVLQAPPLPLPPAQEELESEETFEPEESPAEDEPDVEPELQIGSGRQAEVAPPAEPAPAPEAAPAPTTTSVPASEPTPEPAFGDGSEPWP